MIKVRVKKDNDIITNIKCSGHAAFDEYGKDIVCASFSTMVIVSINLILEFDEKAISYTDTNNLEIVNIKKDNITNTVLNNLVNMMYELKESYDKNIDIKEEK